MVCHIRGQLGTKVVISALGILALYMRFNGNGIWGGETISIFPCFQGCKLRAASEHTVNNTL